MILGTDFLNLVSIRVPVVVLRQIVQGIHEVGDGLPFRILVEADQWGDKSLEGQGVRR
jgi:hypothetical protein